MNININNYEEFLLLYIDNELDEAERLGVETFLKDHPELESELDVLRSTVSSLPALPGDLKISLMKLASGISAEEAIVLELDGEISHDQLKELDELCSEFPFLNEERRKMKELKLDKNEIIPFENKAELYRHESRVISIRLWRSAVAAAIIGAGLFFGLNETYRPDETELVGVQENGEPGVHDNSEQRLLTEPFEMLTIPDVKAATPVDDEPGVVARVEVKHDKASAGTVSTPVVSRTASEKFSRKPGSQKDDKAIVVLENINTLPGNFSVPSTVTPLRRTEVSMVPPDDVRTEVERLTASKPLDADLSITGNENTRQASLEKNGASIGHVSVINEEKVNRSKFGGFVNKVKRTIEKKTNIKMPEQLRVAGYEIAIK